MRRADLTDLSAFVAVANHKSFRAAANQLGVTPSALSHRMRQLEQRIGARLLHRTTRSVSPTEAGRKLFEQLRPAMDQIDLALNAVKTNQEKPTGRLALYIHPMIAQIVMAPVWRKFLTAYPDVQLEIAGSDAAVDIVAKGYDAGISPREFVALDMTTVRVTPPLKLAVVGSPEYFARNPPPKTPADLRKHNCIQLRLPHTGKIFNWMLSSKSVVNLTKETKTVAVSGNLIVEDINLAMRAAIDGLGITFTLETLAEFYIKDGHLVRVLEEWSPSYDGFYLYYSGQRQVPTALRALIDMIKVSYRETKRLKRPELPFL
jgi:DNA-binding transcriptional LysR family regulator